MKSISAHSSVSTPASMLGLTRIDVLVAGFATLMLIGWFGASHVGERRKTAQCSENLRVLGQLMHKYADEQGGSLPPASIERPSIAWDMQIAPYLSPNQLQKGFESFFLCPSDNLQRARPRSYAMPMHDMTPGNWPPGADNKTGVGLSWNNANIKRFLGDKAFESVSNKNFGPVALIKPAWFSAPADTVLLTELIDRDNTLKSIRKTTVSSPVEQKAALQEKSTDFHNGKFNYLMADGHVEALSPLQTGTLDGSGGIWTISKGR